MKIAAGCFGCLAFIFLLLAVSWGWIYTLLVNAVPDAAMALGPMTGMIQYINSGCCCLSAVLAVVFLVIGSMGKKNEDIE